jgi:hypothetical protein
MITAAVLCAHLLAAHVATGHCAAKSGPTTAVTFDVAPGSKGYAMVFSEADWQSLGLGGAIGSPQSALAEAAFTQNHHSIAKSDWAHMIVSVPGAVSDALTWWIGAVDAQAFAAYNKIMAQRDIAEERSNPSGVVDLVALHTAGDHLQAANATLVSNGAEYKRTTGLAIPSL